MTGAFEILTIDPAQKRIGIALVEEGSSRAAGATGAPDDRQDAAERAAAPSSLDRSPIACATR